MLNMEDVKAIKGPAKFTCYGLGSCVGLFIHDRVAGVSGGAHIFLPEKLHHSGALSKGAKECMDHLLESMKQLGSDLKTLRAKVIGGASLGTQTGKKISDEVVSYLVQNSVFIAAQDLGGNMSRTVHFNSETGEAEVSTSERKKYIL